MNKLLVSLALVALLAGACRGQPQQQRAAADELVGAVHAAAAAADAPQNEESYQRVYDAFTKLVSNVGQNSLGNARRLVSRLNQLVGGGAVAQQPQKPQPTSNKEQTPDEKTEQILQRLDQVNKDTDQNTLRQLNEDVNKLVNTLGDSYLRNIRRLIERVNNTVGSAQPAAAAPKQAAGALHQDDRLNELPKQPGFPGWDELIVAVDRVQKSLASFVRSTTRLVTSG